VAFLSLKDIIELVDKVADRDIGLLEIETAGTRLRIEGRRAEVVPAAIQAPVSLPANPASRVDEAAASQAPAAASAPVEDVIDASWHVITSPIVGTFYEAPNPEADPFARVGDRVSKGAVLCIIEAMKLMNEIESDVDGEIVKIFPKNGQPIEYGENLFALKLS